MDLSNITQTPGLSGVLGLWSLGIITWITRDVPKYLYGRLCALLLVSIEIPCTEDDFYRGINWLELRGYAAKIRSIRVTRSLVTPGLGTHAFAHRGRPFWVGRRKEETKSTTYAGRPREELTITTVGRSQRPIRALLEEIRATDSGSSTIINYWSQTGWSRLREQPKRRMETLFLPYNTRYKLLSSVKLFLERGQWYLEHGIPYRMGICLHGPPGTGKTSIAKAICGEFSLKLYTLSLSGVSDATLQSAMAEVEPRSVVLIEDIDCFDFTTRRAQIADSDRWDSRVSSDVLTLSGLLNGIDGVANSDANLFVFTTNRLSSLDPALLRPGRIDLSLHIANHTVATIQQVFKRFYPHFDFPESVSLRTEISPAQLQSLILSHPQAPELVFKSVARSEEAQSAVIGANPELAGCLESP